MCLLVSSSILEYPRLSSESSNIFESLRVSSSNPKFLRVSSSTLEYPQVFQNIFVYLRVSSCYDYPRVSSRIFEFLRVFSYFLENNKPTRFSLLREQTALVV